MSNAAQIELGAVVSLWRYPAKHAIAHIKVMLIDDESVITGSLNFTKAADEKNAENLLVISSTDLATKYLDNWRKHWEHSEDYKAKGI